MNDFKTVPHQKVVSVKKEMTDEKHYYCKINLNALESASRDLQAGAFKLWIYFSKNQPNYTFALSSKEVEESFGIKIKQYNNAIAELIEKRYLVQEKGNQFFFYEIPQQSNSVITKEDNEVDTKKDNEVDTKEDNELLPKDIRNITEITNNTTKQNTFIF